MWRNLEYVMTIFKAFLLNISFGGIGEQMRRKPSVLSRVKLVRQTVMDVLEPLLEMTSRESHETEKESSFFSTLLLQYALGELELFMRKFNLIEEGGEGTELVLPSVVWNDEIGDYVPAKAKGTTVISRDRERLWYIKNALCIQNIRSVLLKRTESSREPDDCELQKLVSCVCSSVSEGTACSAPWDRQELSINKENALLALWDLISRHAVVLLPLCTADQQLILARLLIKTIAQQVQEKKQPNPGFITMADVSLALIQNTTFHEMLAMQTSTVCAVWGQLKQFIDCTGTADSLGGKLSKALNSIDTLQFSSVEEDNQVRVIRQTAEEEDSIDNDKVEENEDVDDDQNATESEDEDSGVEEDVAKETESRDTQCVGSLHAFRTLGCELIDVAKSMLCSDAPVGKLATAECHHLLKVLGYLPLDWLSDDNHSRCLIGLFTCDMLFNSALLKNCSLDALKPLLLSRQLLTVMFDGCVSRKRFIAHHVIDIESLHLWLVDSTTKLWQMNHTEQSTASGMHAMLGTTRGLMYSSLKYILRAPSYTTYADQSTIQKLQDNLKTFSMDVQQCSRQSLKKTVSCYHAVSAIVEGILALCEEVVCSKTSSTKMIRISSDVVIKLGPSLLELLRMIIQASKRMKIGKKEKDAGEGGERRWHGILLQYPVLIDSFSSLLHTYSVSEQSRKLRRVNEELKQCEWQGVFDVMLTAVTHHVFERNVNSNLPVNEVGSFHSCLHFLKIVCQSYSNLELQLPEDFHIRLLASALHFLRFLELNKSKPTETQGIDELQPEKENNGTRSEMLGTTVVDEREDPESKDFMKEGYGLVVSLLEGCDPVLLPELLEGLCSEIATKSINKESLDQLFVSLNVWLRLLSGRFTKDRRKELRPKLPKVLFALQFLLQELKNNNREIVHLALEVMVKILSLGKGMVLSHNALLVLHSSLVVNLAPYDNSFPLLFESQYFLLSTLLFQHSEAVYGAVHVFITCVRNLLHSLIQTSGERKEAELAQDGSHTNAATFKQIELTKCAQRMARLYQEVSSHKSTFSKYSPYMIADYIHGVQTVAIPSVIRNAIVPGVYCLLDMCGEHELSLMHAVLEKGYRELFHSLHADYTKYHKFKGKV